MSYRSLLLSLALIAGSPFVVPHHAHAEEEPGYRNTIRPFMAQRCLGCHDRGSPTLAEFDKDKAGYAKKLKGPRMDSYRNLMVFVKGEDAGALMRRLDDGTHTHDGKPGNMYVNLGDTEAERNRNLALFKRRVSRWTLKHRKEMTDAEWRAIRARR